MRIENFENIYLVGIGGIGMSALARYFHSIGKNVFGYDRTATLLTSELQREGIGITFEDELVAIPHVFKNVDNTLVVYTPAIPSSNKQLNYFKNHSFSIMKRSQVLGLISNGLKGIAVAGTHGKTTVSTLTAHVFAQSKLGCNAFLGGISRNYQSNLLINNQSEYMVLEADEFDRSFLHLFPQVALITSMDADHLDIYGDKKELENTFNTFANQIKQGGVLLHKKGLPVKNHKVTTYTYSLNEKADFYAANLELVAGYYQFDLVYPEGQIADIKFSYPGKLNVENAVAAAALALICGVDEQSLKKAMNSFTGIRRRFDYQIKTDDLVFIDDYAHHPAELRATISSVRELYPNKKLTGVFQPHLYSRTKDFAPEFAESLNLLDEVILLDIYPAREEPIAGVDSNLILKDIAVDAIKTTKQYLIHVLEDKSIEVLLTLGAGDIDKLVEPIKNELVKRISYKKKEA